MQRSSRVLPLVGVAVLALAAPAHAQVQTKFQLACSLGLHAAGAGLARAVAKRFVECTRQARRGRLPAGTTLADCLAADPHGRVADAQRRVARLRTGACVTIPAPSVGAATAAAVEAAFATVLRGRAVFGPDLDAAMITLGADRRTSMCQEAVTTAMAHLAIARLRTFNRCAAAGLRDGAITSAAALEDCVYADPSGVVARAAANARRKVARRCADVTLGAAFPGTCGTHPAFFTCVEQQVDCEVCAAVNHADRLTHGCHRFTDGVATTYCGERPAAAHSVARAWDEQILAAIRIDLPRPPVHAKNLFYLSAAMWDAWVAHDVSGTADPVFHSEAAATIDPDGDRTVAISFAAYRVLTHLYRLSANAPTTAIELTRHLHALGYDKHFTTTVGSGPAALGNRIAATIIAHGLADGSHEADNYRDPSYTPVNEPLIVKLPGVDPTLPGTVLVDPNRWQPLALDFQVSQNGIPLPNRVQVFVGSQWDAVAPFALTRTDPGDVYIDPGPPPALGGAGDAEYKAGVVQLLVFSQQLDPTDPTLVDISPASFGNNPLGTNDGTGYALNPVTGLPYPPQPVKRADFSRVLAEFWADGPESETPPGHWNVVANYVSDQPSTVKRIGGVGPVVDDLEWDVKLYLALNGAVHDAAIACWGIKRKYDSVRPISQVRHMATLGQSSDPLAPSYHASGLPLVPGVAEIVTAASSATGERHAALAAFVGEVAVRVWPGEPPDPATQFSPATWVRAKNWVPYQRKTFVTPPFAAYPSGHSTYSRAAAEVLTQLTGSPYFPGGLGEFVAPANAYLKFELGPTADVRLQWATYYDAADQAGLSRLYGGIHPRVDDFTGRQVGAQVGLAAWGRASAFFAGTAVP